MLTEEELWPIACDLVLQHGEQARIVAATWQADFREAGGSEASSAWEMIGRMIAQLCGSSSPGAV